MNEAEGAPATQAPGWYPAEGGTLCWWDGTAWTPYYISPTPPAPPKRTPPEKIALALFVSPLVLLTLGGLAVMGDPGDAGRFGVVETDGTIQIVPVTCPGERYQTIELRRVLGTYPDTTETVLWRIEGDALPAEVLVGDTPTGMVEVVPFVEHLSPDDQLLLVVKTNQLTSSPLRFSLDELPESGLLGVRGPAVNVAALRSSVEQSIPCGDPYGDNLTQKILLWTVGLSAALPAVGGVILLVTRKSRRKRA